MVSVQDLEDVENMVVALKELLKRYKSIVDNANKVKIRIPFVNKERELTVTVAELQDLKDAMIAKRSDLKTKIQGLTWP